MQLKTIRLRTNLYTIIYQIYTIIPTYTNIPKYMNLYTFMPNIKILSYISTLSYINYQAEKKIWFYVNLG